MTARGRAVPDFAEVSEIPGADATAEQLSMLYARYHFAKKYGMGRHVLEVACGAGTGLRYLATHASLTVGGDYDDSLLKLALGHAGRAPRVVRLDAQTLPFQAGAFDVVILFEALYYLAEPVQFVGEARRVLRSGGILLISTVNRLCPGFVPSRYAIRYLTASELSALFASQGFSSELYGAFPVAPTTARDRIVLRGRRIAARLHLIPSTLQRRRLLKRLAYGKLSPIPWEVIDGMAKLPSLVPLDGRFREVDFKVLYAVGRRP